MTPAPLTRDEERRRKQMALYSRLHGPDVADKYRAKAEWWRLEGEVSARSDECYWYAENQDRIADDMEARPAHHSRKPLDVTRYQWMQRP